jgi:hypothetical protein
MPRPWILNAGSCPVTRVSRFKFSLDISIVILPSHAHIRESVRTEQAKGMRALLEKTESIDYHKSSLANICYIKR